MGKYGGIVIYSMGNPPLNPKTNRRIRAGYVFIISENE